MDLAALQVRSAALAAASTRVFLTQPAPRPPNAAGFDPARFDICSRVFASPLGIDEDPVTGAAHTSLAPFWLDRGPEALVRLGLAVDGGERVLRAQQVSRRGGELVVVLDREGKRVELRGSARRVMRGVLEV